MQNTHTLFVVGLNHRTAPLDLREQLALTDAERQHLLDQLMQAGLEEVAALTTCNRLEVYGVSQNGHADLPVITDLLAELRHIPAHTLRASLYIERDEHAVQHLMRVATGLDSMILGEAQILGQVGQALAAAQTAGTAGPLLSHLFTLAAHAGKRARTETDISRHVTSVSHAAVALAQAQIPDLRRARALVVGSGEMAYLAAQALHRHNVQTIHCINRTYARAADLALAFNGAALDWHELPDALAAADVVISATAAPHTVIQLRDVQQALPRRAGHPLVIIDIALPRDVDESVRALPGVHYHDLDDLNAFVQANVNRREAAVAGVDAIIEQEAARFLAWQRGRTSGPVITALRDKATALAQDEVEAALRRLGDLDAGQQKVVELMAHRIVNKILHEPTVRLKADTAYAEAVRDLFALNDAAEG